MATLTVAAYYTRKYIRWGLVGLVIFIVGRILFTMLLNYIIQQFPPNPLVPNNAFDTLPKITFPANATPSGQLTFTLETVSGSVPEASSAAKVYFMPKNRVNLLSLSRAQTFVDKIGFKTSPRQISETSYRWIDVQSPLRTIQMDTVTNHFTLNYLYQHDLQLFSERQIPSPPEAIREALSFLQAVQLSMPDIDVTQPKIEYLKLVGNELQPATSQSQADAVRIDFFRKNYDATPMVTDKRTEGNISFILSGSKRSDRRILYVKYNYWPIATNTTAIYKLKTSQQAWLEFLEGKAYFASFPPNQTDIAITSMYLAYYDGSLSQLFLQPVFVIEGENNFVAYVPAVAPPWVEQ